MSYPKYCSECNWEYPSSYNSPTCKFCRGEMSPKLCSECDERKPLDMFYVVSSGPRKGKHLSKCIPCRESKEQQKAMNRDKTKELDASRIATAKHDAKVRAECADLLMRLKDALPKQSMTEAEWMEVCSHFGGCAVCGEEHIETRFFFIDIQDGGKYAKGNVLPMCGRHAKFTKRKSNPFLWLTPRMGQGRRLKLTAKRLAKIEDYFMSVIEEHENGDKTRSD